MSERTVYARWGRLYASYGPSKEWIGNCTEVSATMKGSMVEGTLTFDQINANFEKLFIDSINKDRSEAAHFFLEINLEDPGNPIGDPSKVYLNNVKFWSMPMGFSRTDIVTRDMDFTASGITIEEDRGFRREYTIKFSDIASTSDDGVSAP